jgi:ribosome-binding factor A
MPRPKERAFNRLDRVPATMKRVLAAPMGEIARAHGSALVSITRVEATSDLRSAVVYLSVLEGPGPAADVVAQMGARAAELQGVLGRALRTKRTPILSFRLDDTLARADRINRLLGASIDDEPGD